MNLSSPKVGEEVKSLIVGPLIHSRLKTYCKENGFLIRPFVEKIISAALDSELQENKVIEKAGILHG